MNNGNSSRTGVRVEIEGEPAVAAERLGLIYLRDVSAVMAGLVPAIHVYCYRKTWMPGTSPA
ncbi:hypothetical protein [uncultured Bradyrhizobium sp.]|uniref:hypothetical protein n=1 Tax=uncultured Bradyrhizobium sp. TaxID=199684 RepID=UPI0035CA2B7B